MAIRNISKAALARQLNVDQKTPGNWTRDNGDPEQTEPTATNLAAICEALNVSADYLLGRSSDLLSLAAGRFIIDLDEERNPSSASAVVAIEIPARFEIVEQDEAAARSQAATQRWRNSQKGRR